jgi:hypothetical protein
MKAASSLCVCMYVFAGGVHPRRLMRATTNGPQNMSSNKLARIEIINAIREARTFDSVVILFGPTLLIYEFYPGGPCNPSIFREESKFSSCVIIMFLFIPFSCRTNRSQVFTIL